MQRLHCSALVLVLVAIAGASQAQYAHGYQHDRDGGSQIYVMERDGSTPRRLTRDGYNYGPRWLPARRSD